MEGYNRWCRIRCGDGSVFTCDLNKAVVISDIVHEGAGLHKFEITFLDGSTSVFRYSADAAKRVHTALIMKLGLYGTGIVE